MLSLLLTAVAAAGSSSVRSFGTAEGMSSQRVRSMAQDADGFMWFATWNGLDRFDGRTFRNYRPAAGDAVRLDNNRIEGVAADSLCELIWLRTYTDRIYSLDPRSGLFAAAGAADSALWARRLQSKSRMLDRDGNLWRIVTEGVAYEAPGHPSFRFIDLPLDPALEAAPGDMTPYADMHALHVSPDGRIWTASRDGRLIVLDSEGRRIANINPDGTLADSPYASFGRRVYAIHADAGGRMWIGTKSDALVVLTPCGEGYEADVYTEADGLVCANVYHFAEDSSGTLWLATFGGGPAAVRADSSGVSFRFFDGFSRESGSRVRRLRNLPGGYMAAATTSGVVHFRPDESPQFRFVGNGLSNSDVLDVFADSCGRVYFAESAGGIDSIGSAERLVAGAQPVSMRLQQDGAPAVVMSIIADSIGTYWVTSSRGLFRYDSEWRQIAVYDSRNLGMDLTLTEASPATLPDGRLVFGCRGGLLIVSPPPLSAVSDIRPVVTSVEHTGSHAAAVRFTVADFTGSGRTLYAFRNGGDWIELGGDGSLQLSGLPPGRTTLQLRCTDPYGTWSSAFTEVEIDIERTWRDIAVGVGLAAAPLILLLIALRHLRRYIVRRRRRRALHRAVDKALSGTAGEDLPGMLAATVGAAYGDASLKTEHIASELSMTRGELRAAVRAHLGVNVEEFVRAVRVEAASRLLGSSELNVAQVAYRCGFKSPQYMAMVFKEHKGMSPGQYAAIQRQKM